MSTDETNGSFCDHRISRRDLLKYGGLLGGSLAGASALSSCDSVVHFSGFDNAGSIVPPPASSQYLVIFLVDACRGDYLGYGNLPNIHSLIKSGTYYPNAFSGIMESTTPACHASLGTGSFPKNDGGVLGFWWENSADQKYTCANLSDPSSATGAVDPTIIENLIRDAKAPTMASLLKDSDPKATVYAGSGVKFYAADAVGGPHADYITYFWNDGPNLYRPVSIPGHELPAHFTNSPALASSDWFTMTTDHPGLQDTLVVDLAIDVVKAKQPRIVTLNLGEMDWPVAHLYGGPADRGAVTHLMENADAALGRLMQTYRELGIFDETTFCFMGDHGVLPLEQQVNPGDFPLAVKNAGTSLAADDFHTGAFFWLADPPKAVKVSAYLDELKEPGVAAIYFLGEVAGRRQYLPSPLTASSLPKDVSSAYGYLLETMNGANAPHVVMLYEERTGTLGAGGNYPWKGDHGGTSWASQNIALAMAGPGIRTGFRSQFPARLVDLAPTFLRLLGVASPGMDGIKLADAFTNPTAGEQRLQAAAASRLIPIASTLRHRSGIEARALHGSTSTSSLGKKTGTKIPLNPSY